MTGLRYTSAEVVSVDVEAYAGLNPATENGCAGVVFQVSWNGGEPFPINVTDRTLRYPRFSDYSYSQMPGASANNHYAAVFAYGINLPLDVFPVGYLTVTAVAYAVNGSAYPLPGNITIYNDHDGVDRRPNTKHIYVDSVTGNDANSGAIDNPVATLNTALFLGRKNPAGSTSDDADVHGLTIHLADGLYVGGGSASYQSANIHTSGEGWVTVVSDDGGARITASIPSNEIGVNYPQTYLFANGYNSAGNFRIAFQNCKWEDVGLVVRPRVNGSVNVAAWIDGGESYSTAPKINDHSVRFLEKAGDPLGIANDTNSSGFQQRFCTGHYRHHVTNGWLGWTMVMDCMMEHYSAIAFNNGGVETNQSICNVVIRDQQSYGTSPTCSYVTDGYTMVVDGAKSNIVVGGIVPAGMAAIVQTGAFSTLGNAVATTSFGPALNHLIGSKTLGIYLSGNQFSANNGVFEVIATGVDGAGNEYAIYLNPSAVAEGGRPSRVIATGNRVSGLTYNQLHPDLIQYTPNTSNHLSSSLAAIDLRETQTYYSSGGGLTNMWWVNCSAGSHEQQNAPLVMGGSNALRDCGWINCTFSGRMYTYDSQPHSNNSLINCVFDSTGSFATSSGMYANGCHWIDTSSFAADPAFGLNATSGAFHDSDISVDPFDMTPDAPYIGTGVQITDVPAAFAFPGASGAVSKGVLVNVATLDWLNLSPDMVSPVSVVADHLSMATFTIEDATAYSPRSVTGSHLDLSETLALHEATALHPVIPVGDAQVMPMEISDAASVIDVHQTYEFNINLFPRFTLFEATSSLPQSVTADHLSISPAIEDASSRIDYVLTYPATPNMSLRLWEPTISSIAAVEVDSLSFSPVIHDATLFKVALGASSEMTMPLTLIDQPQEITGGADHQTMVVDLHEPSITISGNVSADHLSMSPAIIDGSATVDVVCVFDITTLAVTQWPADVGVGVGLVLDHLTFASEINDPIVKISCLVVSDTQTVDFSIIEGSVGIAPTVVSNELSLSLQLDEPNASVDVHALADSLSVGSISLHEVGGSVGSTASVDSQQLTMSLHEPLVESAKVVSSDELSMLAEIYEVGVSSPVYATIDSLTMPMELPDAVIPGGFYDVGDLYVIPSGETRVRLSGELLAEVDPTLIEEWRVVFRPQ